jgi:hypothetical protein
VDVCPTHAIHEINFPPKKERPEKKKVARSGGSTQVNTSEIEVKEVDVVTMAKKKNDKKSEGENPEA